MTAPGTTLPVWDKHRPVLVVVRSLFAPCCAVALGAGFLADAHRLRSHVAAGGAQAPMRLFHLSIAYLTMLFAAVAVAALLPWGRW